MIEVNGIKPYPSQKIRIKNPSSDGSITLKLIYRPRTRTWYVDVSYESFIANGIKLTRMPNLLSQFRNIINFGIGIIVEDNFEPFLVNDFSSGRVKMYILDDSDIQGIADFIGEGL